MEYETFKSSILTELRKYSGNNDVVVKTILKYNMQSYDGIYVIQKGINCDIAPIVDMGKLYELYKSTGAGIEDCIKWVLRKYNLNNYPKGILGNTGSVTDWELVKEKVYPILISTEKNGKLLQELVSVPMMDLSIIYEIRIGVLEDSVASIKINKGLLSLYGIGKEDLHRQAMENIEQEGYSFTNMNKIVQELLQEQGMAIETEALSEQPEMYVLTNPERYYGAAGILNKKLLQEFAGGQDFVILPSSVHETIFVPVTDGFDRESFDDMVEKVNTECVRAEERLSDHVYLYDAQSNEVRMCIKGEKENVFCKI